MPWRETSPMEQRLDFVREFETALFTMTELAAQYGISRKTGYKWFERYAAAGATGLQDRSRRPQQSPHATDPELVELLVAQRRRHPRWGAKKLLAVAARRQPDADWPSRSTVCALLSARGLVVPRPRRPRSPHAAAGPMAPSTAVNEVLDDRFQRRIPHRRRPALLSVDAARSLQSLRPVVRWVSEPQHRRHTRPFRPGISRVWIAAADSQRQRRSVRDSRPRPAVAAQRAVDAPGHHPGADCARASGTKLVARTVSLRLESRNGAAASATLHRATAAVSPLRPRVQPRAAA